MNKYNIAIIGCGIGGLSSASLLKLSGHNVTLFEKFDKPRPVGAGLLLQPSGLSVLEFLGIDKELIDKSSKIDVLYGTDATNNTEILNVRYDDINSKLFGLGTHRGLLFNALYNKVKSLDINIITSCDITEINDKTIIDINNKKYDGFDLIIDASGQNSNLLNKYADIKYIKKYPFGALWSVVKLNDEGFLLNTLTQKYLGSNHMIGVLPLGKIDNENEYAAYFYSINTNKIDEFKANNFKGWQEYAIKIWPRTKNLVEQFSRHDDLIISTYKDIVLNNYFKNNIVFIGDAAHCTSPQLGQGANLALIDAKVLCDCINENENIEIALKSYNKQRKRHIWIYQTASRFLTPFFQSESKLMPILRHLIFGIICKLSIFKKLNSKILIGTKNGIFTKLNLAKWSKNYKDL